MPSCAHSFKIYKALLAAALLLLAGTANAAADTVETGSCDTGSCRLDDDSAGPARSAGPDLYYQDGLLDDDVREELIQVRAMGARIWTHMHLMHSDASAPHFALPVDVLA